ncbi:MAG: dTDP-4-dehydrorhamnose 3,5-epimerase family protein [Gemmataceae bacterium]|nr:dTDP-4-dehydrorhamnose 3,5-epimerase family protein [Gemmataceae bacterium]MCI0737779.1 dTDP-4-dehydrorhamnose 3,5-epimerase family protein [Gemmataceae bacterium]
MPFQPGKINGIHQKLLRKFSDARGWLCELYRNDELPAGFHPEMAYLSETNPGVVRGPHEHRDQTDCFCFLGPYQVDLWDNRPDSPTYQVHERIVTGKDEWSQIIIPPGVVHSYKNLGSTPALVINCPNRLYKGPGRHAGVDEIRHEDDPSSPFR